MIDSFKNATTKEFKLYLVIGVCLIISICLIIILISKSHTVSSLKLDIEELKIDYEFDSKKALLEAKVYKLELENVDLLNKYIAWRKQKDSLEVQITGLEAKEKAFKKQLNKLKYEIAHIEKPNVNYRDSSIATIDSLLPK